MRDIIIHYCDSVYWRPTPGRTRQAAASAPLRSRGAQGKAPSNQTLAPEPAAALCKPGMPLPAVHDVPSPVLFASLSLSASFCSSRPPHRCCLLSHRPSAQARGLVQAHPSVRSLVCPQGSPSDQFSPAVIWQHTLPLLRGRVLLSLGTAQQRELTVRPCTRRTSRLEMQQHRRRPFRTGAACLLSAPANGFFAGCSDGSTTDAIEYFVAPRAYDGTRLGGGSCLRSLTIAFSPSCSAFACRRSA